MKVVTYRSPIDDNSNNTVIKETRCEDPIAFIQEMRASHKKGYLYNILNIAEESGVALRDAMNAELTKNLDTDFICIKSFVKGIMKYYYPYGTNPKFDSNTKEMYLIPSYNEFIEALKSLAYIATERDVTETEIREAYNISPDDYYNTDCFDWDNITKYILEYFVDEPEYSLDTAIYEKSSSVAGWDYGKEQIIEKEATCLDNYDDLKKIWKAEIISNIRAAMSSYKTIGGVSVDDFLSNADIVDFLVDAITDVYPFPEEDEILKTHLDSLKEEPDYEPDWR